MINTNGILRMKNKEFARVNNFSILPSTFTSPDKPVAEGYANAIKNTCDEYITMPGKSYTQVSMTNLKLICHNNNWQYIRNVV